MSSENNKAHLEVRGDLESVAVDANLNNGDALPITLSAEAASFMEKFNAKQIAGNEELSRRTTSLLDNAIREATQSMTIDRRESAIRFTKHIEVNVEWRNLTYTVPIGRGKKMNTKVVLDNLSAAVPAGRLVAVMGPTGCGKTSLINALAGRLPVGGNVQGQILLNGVENSRGLRAISAYVMQDDALFSNLTVRETFEFAARIRLPREMTKQTRKVLVDGIITELGLSKAQNTRIGNDFMRGVSGGERKRTNIGIELLSGATLLYLDEPTSGKCLDAFQALSVMQSLWTLAQAGRTVIASIHQPRSSIYKICDLLLLLSEGQQMYYGPADKATAYFSAAGFPCPSQFNPADFFLDVVSMDYRSPEAEVSSRQRIQLLAALNTKEGAEYAGTAPEITEKSKREVAELNRVTTFPNDPFTEYGLLLRRSWKQQSRDRLPQIITLIQTIVIGFVLAALYSGMEQNQRGIQDETGILFFVAIFSAFGAMFGALNTFPMERNVVNRERSSKAYHVLPYYLARFVCDIPLRVGQGLLFGCIVYWIVGLNPAASAFFIFVCILIMQGLASQGLGIAVSAGAPNEKVALALAPAVTVILILFGGFYINEDTIPDWLAWIRYLSHLYWSFMALCINDFAGRTGWTCEPVPGTTTDAAVCKNACITTGDQILDRLGFGGNELWQGFLGLGCLIVGFNFIGYVLLRRSKPKYLVMHDVNGKNSRSNGEKKKWQFWKRGGS